MLGRGELRCIGATALNEYRKYIEKGPALERRFQQVFCDQPSVEDTISILRGLRERYELHHGVKISDRALVFLLIDTSQTVFCLTEMRRLKERLEQKKIDLHYTKEAVDLLVKLGFEPNFGARPVKRVIQQMVENELAIGLLRGDFKEEDSIIVDVAVTPSSEDRPPQTRLVIKKTENQTTMDAMVNVKMENIAHELVSTLTQDALTILFPKAPGELPKTHLVVTSTYFWNGNRNLQGMLLGKSRARECSREGRKPNAMRA
ncbi:hypothetical protein F0562_012327 [Nyssa sinensis]|uniref:Clp ATPase C-terminal domain-containing protein n=1 Tax=Nyssa sinensis TaxID=561372 RepID=A0A5J4ZS63_9ASTE|nr:hypothetical protein F0562_012327 [Nyssa sinensis]